MVYHFAAVHGEKPVAVSVERSHGEVWAAPYFVERAYVEPHATALKYLDPRVTPFDQLSLVCYSLYVALFYSGL